MKTFLERITEGREFITNILTPAIKTAMEEGIKDYIKEEYIDDDVLEIFVRNYKTGGNVCAEVSIVIRYSDESEFDNSIKIYTSDKRYRATAVDVQEVPRGFATFTTDSIIRENLVEISNKVVNEVFSGMYIVTDNELQTAGEYDYATFTIFESEDKSKQPTTDIWRSYKPK